MDLIQEVSGDSPFWNEISENSPNQDMKWEDMTRVEQDEYLLQYDEMQSKKMDTSRKNAVIGGLFYLMAFVMFFTELRIVSLLHCIFGTMFMFFYKIGIQAGDE